MSLASLENYFYLMYNIRTASRFHLWNGERVFTILSDLPPKFGGRKARVKSSQTFCPILIPCGNHGLLHFWFFSPPILLVLLARHVAMFRVVWMACIHQMLRNMSLFGPIVPLRSCWKRHTITQVLIAILLVISIYVCVFTNNPLDAYTAGPSDSFPGTLNQLTGASPRTTGVWCGIETIMSPGVTATVILEQKVCCR